MQIKARYSNDMVKGAIVPRLVIFFLPIWLGIFFQQLYNTADAVIVGKYVGKEALAAVGGTTGHLINLFLGFFVSLSSGFSVVIAQQFGANKRRRVSESVHTAFSFAILSGVFTTLVGVFFIPEALLYMNIPPEMLPQATSYLRIYFMAMVPNLIYNMGAAILRAVGDSLRPLIFLIVSCISNIILDILFVIVFQMGVKGAAFATVISQILSALMVLAVLTHTKNDSYRLVLKFLHINMRYLGQMVYIGIAAGFQSAMYTVSNIYIQSKINYFGVDTIAAWTAYVKIDAIFWVTIQSVGIAITTFVGQNFGANNKERVRKGIGAAFCIAAGLTALIVILLLLFGKNVFEIFITDSEVLRLVLKIQRFIVPLYFTYITIEIYSGSLRGVGDCWMPMLITGVGICLLRVVWIGGFLPSHMSLDTILFSYPLSWVITSLLFIIYTHKKSRLHHWLRALPMEKQN